MESFEFPGVWWIPTDPEKTKFYGPLRFDSKNGGKLSLTFDEDGKTHEIIGSRASQGIPIVHGLMDGRKVTLIECHKTIPSWQSRDLARNAYTQTVSIWTDTVFVGAHFESLHAAKFNWMSVSFTHLDNWLGIERLDHDDDGKPYMKPFEPMVVHISNDLKIVFCRALYEEIGGRHSPYPEVLIAEIQSNVGMPYISYDLEEEPEKKSFRSYIELYLRDFMNLVTGEPNYPFNIVAPSPYENRQLVKIYNRIPGYDPDAIRRVEWSFTIPYNFFQPRFPRHLKTWMERAEALRSACELYFKRYYLSNIDIETQFTFLIQAIEAYHRRISGDTYLDCDDYSQLEEMLCKEIEKIAKTSEIESWAKSEINPENVNSLKQSLLNSVKYGNEYSLRRRLKDIRKGILQDNLILVDELLENHIEFINKAIETRNFLAHQLAERSENVLGPSEFPDYLRKLRKLLRLCFLVEMGLPPEEIEQLGQYYPINLQ